MHSPINDATITLRVKRATLLHLSRFFLSVIFDINEFTVGKRFIMMFIRPLLVSRRFRWFTRWECDSEA